MALDTRLLSFFSVIAESETLDDAATRMGVTQSAVSQSLQKLENILDTRLVVRRTRPLQLTTAGTVLKQNTDLILNDLRRLTAQVREAGEKSLTQCRLGLITSISEVFGGQLIFALKNQTEKLTLRSGLTAPLIESYLQRKLDILISDDPLIDLEFVERFKIVRDPMLIAVSEKLFRAGSESVDELAAALPLIKYGRKSQIGKHSDLVLRRMNMSVVAPYETDETHTMIKFVKDGHGWAMLTALCLAQCFHQLDGVRIIELDGSRHARNIYLLSPAGELGATPKLVMQTILDSFHTEVYAQLKRAAPWMRPEIFQAIV